MNKDTGAGQCGSVEADENFDLWKTRNSKGLLLSVAFFGAVLVTLTACSGGSPGGGQAQVGASSKAQSQSPTPIPGSVALTACTAEKATQSASGETFICTADQSGKLVWLDAAASKKITDQRAADAAAKAAAEKAAAEKAAAEKAAAEKAAADQAAAEAAAAQAAAEQAAAAQAAAAAKAAQDAAARAAAEAAARAAIPAAPPAKSGCDPNYSGCVPIASDVDCAGGTGNGPAYLQGTAQVIGSDIYGLDSDKDGLACER